MSKSHLVKHGVRQILRRFGYEIAALKDASIGFHKQADLLRLLRGVARPVIMDIGANVGQTVEDFKGIFPESSIHSFEPSPVAFQELRNTVQRFANVSVNNIALGSKEGSEVLLENTSSVMTSFLPMDEDCWGEVSRKTEVRVDTLDEYCRINGIEHVDVLKTDTQGYDLHVLKGASELLSADKVAVVLIELTFSRLYKGGATIDEVWSYLASNGFRLFSFYNMKHKDGLADWCDAIFVHEKWFNNSSRQEFTGSR